MILLTLRYEESVGGPFCENLCFYVWLKKDLLNNQSDIALEKKNSKSSVRSIATFIFINGEMGETKDM